MSEIEEREKFRKIQEEIHAGIFGNERFEYPGLIKDMSIVKGKQDRDFKLLLPNRILFFILKTIKKPAVLIIFILCVASFFGISYADAIKIFFESIL